MSSVLSAQNAVRNTEERNGHYSTCEISLGRNKKYKIITYQSLCYVYFEPLEVRRRNCHCRGGGGQVQGICPKGEGRLSNNVLSFESIPLLLLPQQEVWFEPSSLKSQGGSSFWVTYVQAPLITRVQILGALATDSCRSKPCKLQWTLVSQVKKIRSYHNKLNSCSKFLFSTWV